MTSAAPSRAVRSLALAVFVVAATVSAAPASAESVPSIGASLGSRRPLYLVSHGWHVGLVLRREDVPAAVWPEKDAFGPVRYLEVGWGDGDYYPAPRGTIPRALRAAFCSRWSVLQVVAFDREVAEMFPRAKILRIDVPPARITAVARYIEHSYAEPRPGDPVVVAAAPYGSGVFVAARGHYSLRENSNTWTARALRIAGCPIDVDAALTAGGLLHQAAPFATVVRPGRLLRESRGPQRPDACIDQPADDEHPDDQRNVFNAGGAAR